MTGRARWLDQTAWGALFERLDADLARLERDPTAPRDEAAWAELQRQVEYYAVAFARRPTAWMAAGLSPMELDEAVQDVCIKLQTRKVLSQLRAAGAPRGYLVRMLRNTAIDHFRRPGRNSVSQQPEDADSLYTARLQAEHLGVVAQLLPEVEQLLPEEERALYRERYVLRRTIGEIAASREISYWAANRRLGRLRGRLRAMKDGPNARKRNKRKRNVNLERLRAAGQANGVPWDASWHQIAQKAKTKHSTISRLLNARAATRSVRAVTLERLADALQVPAEWLSGDRADLPHVPERPPWAQGAESPSLWERPTADYVRWSWLMQRVERAVRRNLDAWYGGKASDAYDSWGRGVVAAFGRLAVSAAWRFAALEPVRDESWARLWASDDGPSLTWLMQIMEPWFEGTAYLNTAFLRLVLEALRASPEAQLLSSESGDVDAIRGLDQLRGGPPRVRPGRSEIRGARTRRAVEHRALQDRAREVTLLPCRTATLVSSGWQS